MTKRLTIFFAAACLVSAACTHLSTADRLNREAAREYLQPVRPGSCDGDHPFWNGFSTKFIYAPAFNFQKTEGAASYRFTLSEGESSWNFSADEPTAALSPVWNEIPVGNVRLVVEALGSDGTVLGTVGEKEFLRDFPFQGPYREKLYSYDHCIKRALSYVHNLAPVKRWETETTPDMSYGYNSYLCKIIGNTIRVELMYAEEFPEQKEPVLRRCRNIAAFIMSEAQKEGTPLAYFPPTYIGDNKAAAEEINKGKTMSMEAVEVVHAFLDLYKASGDKQYYDFAIKILETYRRIQRPDGSFPVKMDLATGEPVNEACGSPHPLLLATTRLEEEFGNYDFKEFRESIERWFNEVLVPSFNWNGQFEDTAVEGVAPYENLTNCTAAPLAIHMLKKTGLCESELALAEDLVRFCEDQFVLWGTDCEDGIPMTNVPCAFEQLKWQQPTDASTSYLIGCFALMYKQTGNELWKAKAEALAANLTYMQNKVTGMIPTWGWRISNHHHNDSDKFWINCTRHTVSTLKMFMEITGEQ